MKPFITGVVLLLSMTAALDAVAQEPPSGSGDPFAQAKFVPDISLVLDVSYLHRDLADEEMKSLFIPGFTHVEDGEEATGHEHGVSGRGFNLNYAELVLASVADPYFDLFGVFHLAEEGFGIEEAFFTTRRLPWGLQVKAGKFLSHFGRMNEQHAHYWDFSRRPLAYSVLFGEESLNELGARLTWVPPLEWYVMLGGEVLQGVNGTSFGAGGFADPSGSVIVRENDHPNLLVTYAKTSANVENLTVLGGISAALGGTRQDHGLGGAAVGHAIDASTTVVGVDLTLKYLLDSFRYVGLQTEFLHRGMDGDRYAKDEVGAVTRSVLEARQAGLYAQLISRLSKQWRAGVRYDVLPMNDVRLDGVETDNPEHLTRVGAMLEYNPTEFSRLRLEYDFDRSGFASIASGVERHSVHEITLQVNMTIGAHGAHAF